jgi:hypothetical protein
VDDTDGKTGEVIGDGRIGFRQMALLVAKYRNLEVWVLGVIEHLLIWSGRK